MLSMNTVAALLAPSRAAAAAAAGSRSVDRRSPDHRPVVHQRGAALIHHGRRAPFARTLAGLHAPSLAITLNENVASTEKWLPALAVSSPAHLARAASPLKWQANRAEASDRRGQTPCSASAAVRRRHRIAARRRRCLSRHPGRYTAVYRAPAAVMI